VAISSPFTQIARQVVEKLEKIKRGAADYEYGEEPEEVMEI